MATNSEKKSYFKQQNIEFSVDRILIKGLGGMAHGLFASLLIGTVIGTIGKLIGLNTPIGAFLGAGGVANADGKILPILSGIPYFTSLAQGAAMAVAIGFATQAPRYVTLALATVGIATNALGGAGGPLAVYVISMIAIFAGKLVANRTPVDLLVTPTVTIVVGILTARLIAPPIGKAAASLGNLIMWATEQQPFVMGIIVSVLVGIILTLPISSAAICAALGLVGLAGGAAVAGCCAHMVGFAICSYKDNGINGLSSVGLGTSMLLVPNLITKPILWLPPVIASAITGPIATVVFKMTQNSAAVSSGMGTCGLVGPIGVVSGWFSPVQAAVDRGHAAISPTALDWIGMALICVVLPAVLSWVFVTLFRKGGLIKDGDYKLT